MTFRVPLVHEACLERRNSRLRNALSCAPPVFCFSASWSIAPTLRTVALNRVRAQRSARFPCIACVLILTAKMSEDKREDDDDMGASSLGGAMSGGGGAAGEPSVRRSMKSTHHPLTVLRCKVAIVGDSKVGKTTLKEMFISGGRNYLNEYNMTVGVDFKVKSVPIPDSHFEVELYMFDCGGEKIFQQREGCVGAPRVRIRVSSGLSSSLSSSCCRVAAAPAKMSAR
jgi:hypothetical protein